MARRLNRRMRSAINQQQFARRGIRGVFKTFEITDGADANLTAFFAVDGGLGVAQGRAGKVNDWFEVVGTGDTSDNALAAAKGSAVSSGDRFKVINTDTPALVIQNPNKQDGAPTGPAVGSDIDLFTQQYSISDPVDFFTTVPTIAHGFWMNADGTRVYHCSDTGDNILAVTLSTPYDVSTATYDAAASSDLGRPFGLWVTEAEDKVFYCEAGLIYERLFGTPGDLSTLGAVSDSITMTGSTSGHAVCMNPDGTKLYMGGSTKTVVEATLSTAYDLSSGSVTDTLDVSAELTGAGAAYGITFDPSGTRLYVSDITNDEIAQYNLSVAYDLTTAVYAEKKLSLLGGAQAPAGIFMHPDRDGTELYGTGQAGGDKLYILRLA